MREFLTLDTSRFPIVVGKYKSFIPSREEFFKAQADIEEFCAGHENFVIILDFSEVPVLSTEYRIASAKWATKNDSLFARQKMKVIFYTPSVLVQLVMKGVLLLSSPSVPHIIVSDLDKAYTWASKQLAIKQNIRRAG